MKLLKVNYVPLDFIKAEIIGLEPNHFHNNKTLKNPKSIYKGELLSKTIYKHKNLSIKIYENYGRIEFSGSLHTYFNNGFHNYNDFNAKAFIKALQLLELELGIRPQNLYILHLEWGYNLKLPMETNYILDRAIQHKSVNKTNSIDCPIDGRFIQFKHSTNILKIYNKGMHFKLPFDLIRIELKQTNWSKYRLIGIKTLQDFIEAEKSKFFNELIHQWQRVILYDIDDNKSLKYIKYQTSTFWDYVRKNKSNKNFKYHFDKLKKLNEEIGFNSQRKITELLVLKGNELQL